MEAGADPVLEDTFGGIAWMGCPWGRSIVSIPTLTMRLAYQGYGSRLPDGSHYTLTVMHSLMQIL